MEAKMTKFRRWLLGGKGMRSGLQLYRCNVISQDGYMGTHQIIVYTSPLVAGLTLVTAVSSVPGAQETGDRSWGEGEGMEGRKEAMKERREGRKLYCVY